MNTVSINVAASRQRPRAGALLDAQGAVLLAHLANRARAAGLCCGARAATKKQ
jgi:hypothetical protein